MSLSAAALIQGFLAYRKHSHIKGVILNQISPQSYGKLKERIEQDLSIAVLGYVPKCPELEFFKQFQIVLIQKTKSFISCNANGKTGKIVRILLHFQMLRLLRIQQRVRIAGGNTGL